MTVSTLWVMRPALFYAGFTLTVSRMSVANGTNAYTINIIIRIYKHNIMTSIHIIHHHSFTSVCILYDVKQNKEKKYKQQYTASPPARGTLWKNILTEKNMHNYHLKWRYDMLTIIHMWKIFTINTWNTNIKSYIPRSPAKIFYSAILI